MSGPASRPRARGQTGNGAPPPAESPLAGDYFRIRDFEYVQPLYDLAFLLEVVALANGGDVPKYRTFSLWRAGLSLDGYGTTVDRWLDGAASDEDLDYVPTARIRDYLSRIRSSGTVPELRSYRGEQFNRCLRLRSMRGLGPSKIALTLLPQTVVEEWFDQASVNRSRLVSLYNGDNPGPWQTAHVVPPLLRFLQAVEDRHGDALRWEVVGVTDPFEPVTRALYVAPNCEWTSAVVAVQRALRRERLFRRDRSGSQGDVIRIKHQMGWGFVMEPAREAAPARSVSELAQCLDPLASAHRDAMRSDLHLHTAWSDGSASVNTMALAVAARGLTHFAVTDHSRSSKLQGGLTPPLWLRQANALTLAAPVCPVLHGIEVDILRDGTLDLPHSLLRIADLVVASVHSNWTDDARSNTDRLIRAIESGCIDILAHPTSAIIGKPGVPDYVRPPAEVHWQEVFEHCARWRVALEMNCFPSRLDLPIALLKQAISAGCAISLGSDAHARSHLLNLRYGETALDRLDAPLVLNRMPFDELKTWITQGRRERLLLPKGLATFIQPSLEFEAKTPTPATLLSARIRPPQMIPAGSRVVGIDLTAGDKATGVALLNGWSVETCSLFTDDEILDYVRTHRPDFVSIDSPLGLPGGGDSIEAGAGIMRVAEHDLASVGIPAYPALIDSMEKLTLRGIRLRKALEQFKPAPRVIESYPGAAQDILCIPRKQKSVDLLREGLRRLGLTGAGLDTRSHDEMDAITSAIVARYFENGQFEPMGITSEAQLIVPKIQPLVFDRSPIICLAGKTGAGKSVVARYLSVFYGFDWVRTRNLIRDLLVEDALKVPAKRYFERTVDPHAITEADLRECGAVILDRYKQAPLQEKLAAALSRSDAPQVVDSIRAIRDVDRAAIAQRPVLTWFIDCSESVIRGRLARKSKGGEKRLSTGSPVDRTASAIRDEADRVISNAGSLEDLRWQLDDALFAITEVRA